MKLHKRVAGSMLGMGLLIGAPVSGYVLAQNGAALPTQQAQQAQPSASASNGATEQQGTKDTQDPTYSGSIQVPQSADTGNEQNDAAALQGLAKISADQAKAAALAGNPGATAAKVELDNENGVLVYSVHLSSGADVKVDAGNAKMLQTDQGNAEKAGGANEANGVPEQGKSAETPATSKAPNQ